ncbi:MAG TPA: CHAT domain-containing protein, partial [Gemmatirosa sp.]
DGRYAVERYAVSVAPSAVVVAALRGRPAPPPRPVRLLAFGDPAFAPASGGPAVGRARGADDAGATFRSAFDATGGLPRLAASGDEARAVARYSPDAVVRLGAAATAAYLKHAALVPFDVIHFATHALVDDRSVARTSLALAPGGGESGLVSAGDLAALHLAARLVVLSACRSAGGVVVDGEGVQGLTAPLLEAGARSVVATQWRIRDRGTAAFVDGFYDHLAGGLPVADALQAAKRDAIARGAPPAEWAAFTVVGDPTVRVALRPPPTPARWPMIAAAGAALLAAGGLARARRRQAA